MLSSPGTRYTLSPIAETNARFSDFAPYVPSINNHGVVAFQATVSVNDAGQLAIRVRLTDQRQFILRADLAA